MNKGFSLLFVVGLLALATLTAALVIDTVQLDHELIGQERQRRVARESASGGLMEVINDHETLGMLPTPASPSLSIEYNPSSGSLFSGNSDPHAPERSYKAKLSLHRIVPMQESSHGTVRAVVYGIEVDASVGNGQSNSGVTSEVFKVATAKQGVVMPRKHAQ